MDHVLGSTATAVCRVRSGCGPDQTASVWPLWLRMCWLLSGQRPLLCLGWSHLLQILPCWSLHKEVTAHSSEIGPVFIPCRYMCLCVTSAVHTFTSKPLFHQSILPWISQRSTARPPSHYHMTVRCYAMLFSMHLITTLLSLSVFLSFSLFAFFLSLLLLISHDVITCSKLLSLYFPFFHLSRRFRRQDVRHGNAVQLCNGMQIDG